MIARITGRVVEVREEHVVLEAGGVGYDVLVPGRLADRLRDSEDIVTLHTLHDMETTARGGNIVPRLVGFASPVDRAFFAVLLQVRGLGTRKAIRSLTIPIRDFAVAIEAGDTGVLSSLPGIGARMAEKIVAELRGKVSHFAQLPEGEALAAAAKPERPEFVLDALDVLQQLGYRSAEALRMIDDVLSREKGTRDVDHLLRAVFERRGEGR